jgi:hypothetical protein
MMYIPLIEVYTLTALMQINLPNNFKTLFMHFVLLPHAKILKLC